MKKTKVLVFIAYFLISLILFVGLNLSSNFQGSYAESKTELTLSAAASLRESLSSIKPFYQKVNPNIKIVYNFGSSGSLEQQIEQGAPVAKKVFEKYGFTTIKS